MPIASMKGQMKSEEAEGRSLVSGPLKLREIHLEAGEEHQEELAELREEADDLPGPGIEEWQARWDPEDAGEDVSDRTRKMQALIRLGRTSVSINVSAKDVKIGKWEKGGIPTCAPASNADPW